MNVNKYKPDYSLISKYRAVLMGFAIILIMFCHMDVAQEHNGIATTSLARTLHLFTVGVDIFLFLSGVGLYYSYTKKNQSYGDFEKKRLARILPYYFVIGGVTYLLYDIIINHLTLGKWLSDLLFVPWFKEGKTRYWYILAIIVFYLLFPLFYRFIHTGRHGLLKTILFSICWWSLVEILSDLVPGVVPFRIALQRMPVFVIGIYFGGLSYKKVEMSKGITAFLFLSGYVLFVALKTPFLKPIADNLYYPVRAMLAISIMTTVIILMEIAGNTARGLYTSVMKVLIWFGGLTLELYLLHQSYMILLEFPYKITTYPIAAFLLPTITAVFIYIGRKILKRGKMA